MPHLLENDVVSLRIDLPSDGYSLQRFDWTGKIAALKYKGAILSGYEDINRKNSPHLGQGFYNEFGINSPLGYYDAEIGDWFHKIGVGLLKKAETEYKFDKHYMIKPSQFDVDAQVDCVRIRCRSASHNGYSYILDKDISLTPSGFVISYQLNNNGEKAIVTNEYNHNFIMVNQSLVATDYLLQFPFNIAPERMEENVNPEGIVEIGKRHLRLMDHPRQPFFFSNISGGDVVSSEWSLLNSKSGIAISEQGDFPTNSINLWGAIGVISPELFVTLNVQPGNRKKWSRTYTIFEKSID